MLNAILVSGVVVFSFFTNTWFGYLFTAQPIIVSTLVGLVLGDLQTGIVCGAAFELIFMGAIQVGATVPSDPLSGSAIGTALVILSGVSIETGLALAVPVALLTAQWEQLLWVGRAIFNPFTDRAVEQANVKQMERVYYLSVIIYQLLIGVPTFFAVLFGVDLIETVIAAIPASVTNGLNVAGGLLPAVGIAMLMNLMWNKKIAVFFFVGYLLSAYIHLPILGVALAGVLYCIIDYTQGKDTIEVEHVKIEEEELFND